MATFRGPGQYPTLLAQATNKISLPAGGTFTFPAGYFALSAGRYSQLQSYEPITGMWCRVGGGRQGTGGQGGVEFFNSDGTNYRLANQTGCAVGALLYAAGSGYTSAPVVTAGSGSSLWKAFVGGAVNTSVTIANGGSNYTYPPICVISAPAYGAGIQATAYCALSGGAVNSVTIDNQGAGYTTAPTLTFVNDPRENANVPITGSTVTFGTGAAATLTLTGANTITGLVCLDHGTPITSVPALTFTGGGGSGAHAIAIMCWTITAETVTTQGNGISGSFAWGTALDNFTQSTPAYTNTDTQINLVTTRRAEIELTVTSTKIATSPVIILDGGIYTSVPTPLVLANASVVTTAPVLATPTMGGVNDVSYYMSL